MLEWSSFGYQGRAAMASPACAGSHGYQAVEECTAGVLRSLGEGGHASAGSAEVSKGTTAVKPWGSTCSLVNSSFWEWQVLTLEKRSSGNTFLN
jgi:hypothetical protein